MHLLSGVKFDFPSAVSYNILYKKWLITKIRNAYRRENSWTTYAINILYLLAYNGSAITFYYYVLTLTKPKNTKILTAITYITSLIIVTVLLPTPITHWGIYFDAQKKYQHGFLFPLLYICSLFLLVCAFFVYLQNRKKLNRYQIVSILLEIDKSILWSAMENRKHLLFYVIR